MALFAMVRFLLLMLLWLNVSTPIGVDAKGLGAYGGRSKRSAGVCIDDVFSRSKPLAEADIQTQRRIVDSLTGDGERSGRKLVTDFPDSALEMGKRYADIDAEMARDVKNLEIALRRVPLDVDSGRLSAREGRVKISKITGAVKKMHNAAGKLGYVLLLSGLMKAALEGKPEEAGKALGFFVVEEMGEEIAAFAGKKMGQFFLSKVSNRAVTLMITRKLRQVGVKASSELVNHFMKSTALSANKALPAAAAVVVGLAFQAYGWYQFHEQLQTHNKLMDDPNAPAWQKENSKISLGVSAMSESLGTVMTVASVFVPVGTIVAAVSNCAVMITTLCVGARLEAVAHVETTRDRLGGFLTDAEAGELYARSWAMNKELPQGVSDSIIMREVYRSIVAHFIDFASRQGYKAVFFEIEPFRHTSKEVASTVKVETSTRSAKKFISVVEEHTCVSRAEYVPIKTLQLTEDSYASAGDSRITSRLFDVGSTGKLICGSSRESPRHIRPQESYTDPAKSRRICSIRYPGGRDDQCAGYCPLPHTVLQVDTVYLSAFDAPKNPSNNHGCHNAIGVRLLNASNDAPVAYYPINHINANGDDKNIFIVDGRTTKTIIGGMNDDLFIVIALGPHVRLDGGAGANSLLLTNRGGIPLAEKRHLKNINHVFGSSEPNVIYVPKDCVYVDGRGGGDTIHLVVETNRRLPDEIAAVPFVFTLQPDPARIFGNFSLTRLGGCHQANRPYCLVDYPRCRKSIPIQIHLDNLEELAEILLFTNDDSESTSTRSQNQLTLRFLGEEFPLKNLFNSHDPASRTFRSNVNSIGRMDVVIKRDIPSIGNNIFLRVNDRFLIQPLMELTPDITHSHFKYVYKTVALLILDEHAPSHSGHATTIPFTMRNNMPLYWCRFSMWDSEYANCFSAAPRFRSSTHNPVHIILNKDDKLYTGSDGHGISLQAEAGNYSIYCLQNRFEVVHVNTLQLGCSVSDILEMNYHPERDELEIIVNASASVKRLSVFHYLPEVTQINLETSEGRLSFEIPSADAFAPSRAIRSLRLEVFPIEADSTFPRDSAIARVDRLKNPHFSIMKTLISPHMLIVQDAADRTNLMRLSELTSETDVEDLQPMSIDLGLGSDIIAVDIGRSFTFYLHGHNDDTKRINLRPYDGPMGELVLNCLSFEILLIAISGRDDSMAFGISVILDTPDDYRRLHILHGVNSYSTIERTASGCYSLNTREEHPMLPLVPDMPIVIPADWLDNITAYMPHLRRPRDLTALRLLNSSDLLLFDPASGGALVIQNASTPFHFSYGNELPDYARFQPAESNNNETVNATEYSIDVPDLDALPAVEDVAGAMRALADLEFIPRGQLGVVDLRREVDDPQIEQIDIHFNAQDPENVVFTLPENCSGDALDWSLGDERRSWLIQRPGRGPLNVNLFEASGENISNPDRFVSVLSRGLQNPYCEMDTDVPCVLRVDEPQQYELIKQLEAKEYGTDPPVSTHYADPAPPLFVVTPHTPSVVWLNTTKHHLPTIDAAAHLRRASISPNGEYRGTGNVGLIITGEYKNGTQISGILLVFSHLVIGTEYNLIFKVNHYDGPEGRERAVIITNLEMLAYINDFMKDYPPPRRFTSITTSLNYY